MGPARIHGISARLRMPLAAPEEVAEMTALCDAIEQAVIERSADLPGLLARWNGRARRAYEPREFTMYYGAMSTEDFVRAALAPNATWIDDLKYDEVRSVVAALRGALSEAETGYFLEWLDCNLPGADLSDLLFWPNEWFDDPALRDVNLSDDQIVHYAMNRAGRMLPGAPSGIALPHRDPRLGMSVIRLPPRTPTSS
jgi:hypothetical protein